MSKKIDSKRSRYHLRTSAAQASGITGSSDTGQWELIQLLTPARLSGVQFRDRMVRGEPWLFIHNEITGQHMRINGLARQLVSALDGKTSLCEILGRYQTSPLLDELEAVATSFITLAQHGMVNLGDSATPMRLQMQLNQLSRYRPRRWQNPLAIKFALLDPDLSISRFVNAIRPVLGRTLLIIVLSVLCIAVVTAFLQADKLSEQLVQLAGAPQHWWQMLLLYPFLKFVHEMAHALAIKRLGGFVHEMGISLLILMPMPYVDASDSWRFETRRERILVSAAGMLAEGFLAAIGLLVWLIVEPGSISDMAFAIALMGSVSTLLFNANPLLRFDGYQILQDFLDMPNLGTRSTRYVLYLSKRYLLGVPYAKSPLSGIGERRWLVSYAIGSLVYRWIITLGIALYLIQHFPVLGVILAVFALYQLAIKPLVNLIKYLHTSTELEQHRSRALSVTAGATLILLCILFIVPLPNSIRTEGIVGLSKQAELYAPHDSELSQLYVKSGDVVKAGQPIMQLSAPDLDTRLAVLNSQLEVLELEFQATQFNDPATASVVQQDLQDKRLQQSRLLQSVDELLIRAAVDGRVSVRAPYDRSGQYVRAGAALGHVVNANDLRVKAVVLQNDVSRLNENVQTVHIRLAERFSESLRATMTQQTPAGNRSLPSEALAYNGRSGIAVASQEAQYWKTVEPVFHLEFSLPKQVRTAGIGGRAYITLAQSPESVGKRGWRALRQLLLNQLAI